jgi:hypothetical protein
MEAIRSGRGEIDCNCGQVWSYEVGGSMRSRSSGVPASPGSPGAKARSGVFEVYSTPLMHCLRIRIVIFFDPSF